MTLQALSRLYDCCSWKLSHLTLLDVLSLSLSLCPDNLQLHCLDTRWWQRFVREEEAVEHTVQLHQHSESDVHKLLCYNILPTNPGAGA